MKHPPLRVQAQSRSRFPLCLYSAASTNLTPARHSYLPDSPELRLIRDSAGRTWLDGREQQSFESCLDELIDRRQTPASAGEASFLSGWVIYYGFESYLGLRALGADISSAKARDLPMACLWRVDRQLVYDHERAEWSHYRDRQPIDFDQPQLLDGAESGAECAYQGNKLVDFREEGDEVFAGACQAIIDAIARGDVIQVNLSRPWQLEFADNADAGSLALALADANPSAFFSVFPLGGDLVVSASPERLFRIEGERIETRPLGGTIERLLDDEEADKAAQARLRSDSKLRSEHIMLVDLERNDISAICETGSVAVSLLAGVETHPHLHHLMSVVEARLRPQTPWSRIFRAMCPGGSISGCPKRMCLRMLLELEPGPRQWYTGAFGYIDDSGAADVNLLIRSLAVRGRNVYFRTGGGIVADSAPADELAETRLKARGLLKAIAEATGNPAVLG